MALKYYNGSGEKNQVLFKAFFIFTLKIANLVNFSQNPMESSAFVPHVCYNNKKQRAEP